MPVTLDVGSRARAELFSQLIDDATTGNKDGIAGNEDKIAGDVSGQTIFETNPLLFKLKETIDAGFSKLPEEQKLATFLAGAEKAWGRPVSDVPKPSFVSQQDWNAHLVDKAIQLVRLGRDPSSVTDKYVHASGTVEGMKLADRELFTQTWAPTGPSNGETLVFGPGFLEDHDDYIEQIETANKLGYTCEVYDQQWAGLTSGAHGQIDDAYGITRDAAAVCADAAQSGNHVILVGTSMGGGAGAVGAWVKNAKPGAIELNGPQMPKDVDIVGQDAYFSRTPTLLNEALYATSFVPGLNQIPLPAMGAPVLSSNPAVLRLIAQHATTEKLTAKAQAFHASDKGLQAIKQDLEDGVKPEGKAILIHATRDSLADYDTASQWANLMGAKLISYDSDTHVPEENKAEQGILFQALAQLKG
jgi:alpha-beta hydrolase superfamily lysophospholipase